MRKRGVFLDRDGTINQEVHYLRDTDELRLLDGIAEAIRLLKEAEFTVVVVTNQSAVARNYLSETALQHIHQVLVERLQVQGADIDAIYYCPHHPTEGIGAYKLDCNCRKPKPGMLERAARELEIDLRQSFVVGDKVSDLEAGYAVRSRVILVQTGYGLESEKEFSDYKFRPDYIATTVLDAAHWIIRQSIQV